MIKPDGQVKSWTWGYGFSEHLDLLEWLLLVEQMHYLSPEQARGSMADCNPISIVWGLFPLKCSLARCPLTGNQPLA